jgi:hypothetical protein
MYACVRGQLLVLACCAPKGPSWFVRPINVEIDEMEHQRNDHAKAYHPVQVRALKLVLLRFANPSPSPLLFEPLAAMPILSSGH